jgi:hypothetical protein
MFLPVRAAVGEAARPAGCEQRSGVGKGFSLVARVVAIYNLFGSKKEE